jgi:signal transduction histidine kinase
MFSGLRLRLTLLYLLAAVALVALVGGVAYQLVDSYFQTTTDLALKHKMVDEFQLLKIPTPPELAEADRAWFASQSRLLVPTPSAGPKPEADDRAGADGETNDNSSKDDAYDAELATIFVLSLSHAGQVLYTPPVAPPYFAPDQPAFDLAMVRGDDLRTVTLPDGRRARLLTYRLNHGAGPAAVQLGRLLTDQDRVLKRLLMGLLALGGASVVLMGAGSWWLAGRSIRPAQQAWESQQAFVANASHELRTPLTLLRASAEVAMRSLPAGDADDRALLGDVLQECDHMSRLVEELLLLSRLDAGRLVLARTIIELPELLADVQRQVGRLATERGIQLTTDSAICAVWGDPTRVRQVLLILLDNALRHTPSGGAVRLGARANGRTTQISVADTGSGIPLEHLPHIFDRFYRAESASGDDSGSGLGLSIVKALVEAQGGHIAIESQLEKGTQVVMALPSVAVEDRVQMRFSPPPA